MSRDIAIEELSARLDAGEPLVVLDVREDAEHRAGAIPGAILMPRARIEADISAKAPDRDACVVTYCASGPRATTAAAVLERLGYANVLVARPGFPRWKELGLPVVRGASLLTEPQRERYARHLLLPEVGEEGQAKLLASKVLLVGAGGLGSPAALYLAAAGVGTLGIVDADAVDISNLQRQILHGTSRVGTPKTESAQKAIAELNPDVNVELHTVRLARENVEAILTPYDVIVDGADNFPTRYLLSDAGVWLGKPVVHGAISRFEGQLSTFVPEKAAAKLGLARGPCYRCLYPEPPPPHLAPSCAEAGVLGVLPGMVGTLQATEVLKLLLGRGDPLVGRLLACDALSMKFRELRFVRDPDCAVCGALPRITTYVDYQGFCAG
jgi:sulfur-carrier protein adenylyltransferase/sulfurtransferase